MENELHREPSTPEEIWNILLRYQRSNKKHPRDGGDQKADKGNKQAVGRNLQGDKGGR